MSNQQKAPKQDNSGFGLKAGVGKDKDWKAAEQDGQNRLLTEKDFENRSRMMENE